MEREIRYCTSSDGVRIAYAVRGSGPRLVICPQFVESFSLIPTYEPTVERFFVALEQDFCVVLYDCRGTGMSQREKLGSLGPDAQALDLEAIVDAVGGSAHGLVAWTMAPAAALRYMLRRPGQVARLVLGNGGTHIRQSGKADVLKAFAALARTNWSVAAQTFADMGPREEEPGESMELARIVRDSTTGEIVARMFEDGLEAADITESLPSISVPTLIMHHIDNAVTPVGVSQSLAAAIPGARLALLPGPSGWYTQGNALELIQRFLLEGLPQSKTAGARPGPLRTVLFTDLVGHTEMMSRLGDSKGRDVLREHERITRDVLKIHGGTEVKTMGDGFMASFGSVTKAVECAVALQRAFADREGEPLSVRVGLNAGEPIEEDGDLFGATVILASRIAAKADGGEILVADTVRGLCSGKGFLFADRGEFVAKGFEEPVRISEVSWRHTTAS